MILIRHAQNDPAESIGVNRTLALTLTTKALNSSKAFFACALNKGLTRGPTG